MPTTHFVYKCRACGKLYSKASLPTLRAAASELVKIRSGKPELTHLSLIGGHDTCQVMVKGIGDLVGIGQHEPDLFEI